MSQPLRGRRTQNSIRAGQLRPSEVIFGLRSPSLPVVNKKQNKNMPGTLGGPSGSHAAPANEAEHRRSRHRMPKPGEKNAPVFEPEKPEELGRFFDRVEDWFQDEEIVDNVEKKKRIVRYLDADSEVQWKALSKFSTGSYEEFKAQVMASYPAAEEVMKGSVTALKRKIKKIGPVAPDDRDELLSLIRIMTAEIMKLKKITPPIHTNRELVELFLGRLDAEFAARVANKLTVHRLISANNPANDDEVRNNEDMYDIEEVMEMAKQTSLEQANPFGKFLAVATTQASPVTVKLEEVVARLNDSINLQVQHSKEVDQRLHTLQNFMNQPKPAYEGTRPAQRSYGTRDNSGGTMNCFYCEGPHRMGDCDHVLLHLDLGLLKRVEGKLRLADGSMLPREAGKTTCALVEAMRYVKKGLVAVGLIKDKSSLYPREQATSYVQSRVEEDSERVMEDLIRTLGTERVRQCLQAREEYIAEAEEWEQNFE